MSPLPYKDGGLHRQRARDLCEDLLSDRLQPEQLAHELYLMSVALDHPIDLDAWVGLDGSFGLIGIYRRDGLEEHVRQEARAFVAATPKKFY